MVLFLFAYFNFDLILFHSINLSTVSELGLVAGSKVRLVKKNPFGGPIQIKLNNSYLAIRKEDAQMISVEQ